jgi:hypothetical protein
MARIPIPNSEQPAIEEEKNIFNNAWFMYFQDIYKAIRSSLALYLGGILNNDNTSKANSGSEATDLISYTLNKNIIQNNKDYIEILMCGTYAANGNNKQIEILFGSQTIFDTTALAINGGAWIFEIKIIRTSSNTQDIFVKGFYNDLAITSYVAGTQDFLTFFDIKCIGTGIATDDIIQKLQIINLTPFN